QHILDHAEDLRRWSSALDGAGAPEAAAVDDPLGAAHHLLADLVRDKERHAEQRLFLVCELLYGADLEDIERGLRSKSESARASSLELLENIVAPPLRSRLLALVDDGPVSTPGLTYEQALTQILDRGSSTMKTLAEYRARELGLDIGAAVDTETAPVSTID